MTLPHHFIAGDFATAAQLTPEQMQEAAKAGFRTVVNNRPDFEAGPQQPTDREMREAAEKAGLTYVFFPVISGMITPNEVEEYAKMLDELPRPVLAFCRSGSRSGHLYHLALKRKAQR
ncbi:MAG TPA: TIGR01244 family sulfur transferase [Casimicrobiaceae bacterium]|nr:TIGR01244 family sulfur transferase [Casimicrobiaceae bacterium]